MREQLSFLLKLEFSAASRVVWAHQPTANLLPSGPAVGVSIQLRGQSGRGRWCLHVPEHYIFVRHRSTIHVLLCVIVRPQRRTLKRTPANSPRGSRVRENLGMKLGIRLSRRCAAHWARCHRGIAPDREFA
jgi:hypothetical protein